MINQISCEELRCAAVAQMSRGLRHSAKWVAELLAEVSRYQTQNQKQSQKTPSASATSTATSIPKTKNQYMRFGTAMDSDSPDVLLAKTYFDLGEYGRAAYALRNVNTTTDAANASSEGAAGASAGGAKPKKEGKLDHKALFLRGYSQYLQVCAGLFCF